MDTVRLTYVHALAPPRSGGTATVVHRLLSQSGDLEVETFTDWRARRRLRGADRIVPGRYRFCPKVPSLSLSLPGAELGNVLVGACNALLSLVAGVRAGLASRRHGSSLVLSVMDDGFSVVAGAVAARVAVVPHVIWTFDLWEENAYPRFNRWLAARVEGRLLRGASAILVHADEMAAHLRAKHGVESTVLPTPIEILPEAPARAPSGDGAEVLVSGALYWAQADAVLRLARACAGLEGVRVTVLSKPELVKVRERHHMAFEPGLPMDRVPGRLAAADVLFLGLSFGTPHEDLIRTATPARLPEYMASGVPILVHAPAGSHVAEYARRGGFALVVDEPDEERLAQALVEILENPAAAAARAGRARELAATHHDAEAVRASFRRVLDSVSR